MTVASYIDAVIGEREGFLALAFGRGPYWKDGERYAHKDWTETRFRWPAEMGKISAAVDQELVTGEPVDVYVCPAVRFTNDRRKGSALPPMVCWADLDGPPADVALWDTLTPYVVDSGQPDHRHAYVPLTRPVGLGAHARLNKALADRLGGDAKWSDESLLRLPGSLNFKPATPRNGEPAGQPARVLARPWSGTPWDPGELAALLGVDLEQLGDGAGSTSQTVEGEPVDIGALPVWLRGRLDDQTKPKDASETFHGLVGACKDAGLTQGQTVTVVGSWRYLPDRYTRRVAAEVARSWGKVKAGAVIGDDTRGLPDEFWAARKWLDHVRAAAWSRGRSAEGVLGATVARIAAGSPYWLKLPAIVGSPAGLSLNAVTIGHSGSGKSSSFSIATELLPDTGIPTECDNIPPGSGEGLVELLFEMSTEDDPDTGKPRQVKKQTRYNAYVYVDEGLILGVLNSRGSLLLPTLRSTFTDGALGQANASTERKRVVPAGRYTYGAVIGLQTEYADMLLNDAEIIAGTPQRLIWFPTDTSVPGVDDRPAWPGPLTLPEVAFSPAERGGLHVDVDPAVARAVKVSDQHRRDDGCDPLDQHRDLARLKIACVFGRMDGRWAINTDDWALAGAVMAVSDATRARGHAAAAAKRGRDNDTRGVAQGQREAVAKDTEAQVILRKLAPKLQKKIDAADGEWVKRTALRDPLRPHEREYFDTAVSALVDAGLTETREQEYHGQTYTEYRSGA